MTRRQLGGPNGLLFDVADLAADVDAAVAHLDISMVEVAASGEEKVGESQGVVDFCDRPMVDELGAERDTCMPHGRAIELDDSSVAIVEGQAHGEWAGVHPVVSGVGAPVGQRARVGECGTLHLSNDSISWCFHGSKNPVSH